jgi:hypothetical protein
MDAEALYAALAAGALAAVVLAVLLMGLRRRLLARPGGTFDCSLRMSDRPPGTGWMLGTARYTGDDLEWWRVFSLSPWPKRTVPRAAIDVVSTRRPSGAEATALLAGTVVVECRALGDPLELGMGPDALTGFLSWLEAAPPGQNVHVA